MGLPVPGENGVHDALKGGVGGAKGGEFPQEGLEDGGGHGKDLVEGCTGRSPGEYGAPVAPGLEACGWGEQ